eukprot:4869930-Pleurochrysis_carterae.AAC.1
MLGRQGISRPWAQQTGSGGERKACSGWRRAAWFSQGRTASCEARRRRERRTREFFYGGWGGASRRQYRRHSS